MKNIITLIYCFCLPLFLFAQETNSVKKTYWIDRIELTPIHFQFTFSESAPELFDQGKVPFGGVYHPQLLFQKELNSTISIFTRVGYLTGSESARIEKSVVDFSNLTNAFSNVLPTDSLLQVKRMNYTDGYVAVPIGLRIYTPAQQNKGFRLMASSKIEFLYAVKSKVDVEITQSRPIDPLGVFNSRSRVEDTLYEIVFIK